MLRLHEKPPCDFLDSIICLHRPDDTLAVRVRPLVDALDFNLGPLAGHATGGFRRRTEDRPLQPRQRPAARRCCELAPGGDQGHQAGERRTERAYKTAGRALCRRYLRTAADPPCRASRGCSAANTACNPPFVGQSGCVRPSEKNFAESTCMPLLKISYTVAPDFRAAKARRVGTAWYAKSCARARKSACIESERWYSYVQVSCRVPGSQSRGPMYAGPWCFSWRSPWQRVFTLIVFCPAGKRRSSWGFASGCWTSGWRIESCLASVHRVGFFLTCKTWSVSTKHGKSRQPHRCRVLAHRGRALAVFFGMARAQSPGALVLTASPVGGNDT